jgi:hypothetical protein
MMQQHYQLRVLVTHDTDTSLYIALKIGGRSETGREKESIGEENLYPQIQGVTS